MRYYYRKYTYHTSRFPNVLSRLLLKCISRLYEEGIMDVLVRAFTKSIITNTFFQMMENYKKM
jgi:pyrroloquinoline quinone (PQQ) biosynthesis protein C